MTASSTLLSFGSMRFPLREDEKLLFVDSHPQYGYLALSSRNGQMCVTHLNPDGSLVFQNNMPPCAVSSVYFVEDGGGTYFLGINHFYNQVKVSVYQVTKTVIELVSLPLTLGRDFFVVSENQTSWLIWSSFQKAKLWARKTLPKTGKKSEHKVMEQDIPFAIKGENVSRRIHVIRGPIIRVAICDKNDVSAVVQIASFSNGRFVLQSSPLPLPVKFQQIHNFNCVTLPCGTLAAVVSRSEHISQCHMMTLAETESGWDFDQRHFIINGDVTTEGLLPFQFLSQPEVPFATLMDLETGREIISRVRWQPGRNNFFHSGQNILIPDAKDSHTVQHHQIVSRAQWNETLTQFTHSCLPSALMEIIFMYAMSQIWFATIAPQVPVFPRASVSVAASIGKGIADLFSRRVEIPRPKPPLMPIRWEEGRFFSSLMGRSDKQKREMNFIDEATGSQLPPETLPLIFDYAAEEEIVTPQRSFS